MSELLEKSEQNVKAAKYLIDEKGYHASSIHCLYYSCLQLVLHIMLHKLNYGTVVNVTRSGYHKLLSDTMFKEIKNKGKQFDALKFRTEIVDLKGFRRESDYNDVEVDEEKSKKAYKKAKKIRDILKQVFSV